MVVVYRLSLKARYYHTCYAPMEFDFLFCVTSTKCKNRAMTVAICATHNAATQRLPKASHNPRSTVCVRAHTRARARVCVCDFLKYYSEVVEGTLEAVKLELIGSDQI